jgi:transforming growth factor-beta-induced protein
MRNRIKIIYQLVMFGVVALALGACQAYDPDVERVGTTPEIDSELTLTNRGYNIFADAVAHAGISSEIYGSADSITIFAPTDAAFKVFLSGLDVANITDLDAAVVANVLRYHVVAQPYLSAALPRTLVTLLDGKSLTIVNAGDVISLNSKAAVVQANLITSDAIIHGINAVLPIPAGNIMEVLIANEELSTLVGAIQRVGLAEALSSTSASYTVLAPVNAAFDGVDLTSLTDDQLRNILSFHVLSTVVYSPELPAGGGKFPSILGDDESGQQEVVFFATGTFNGAMPVSTNISADNGVIHTVSRLVLERSTILDALGPNVDVSDGNDGVLADLLGRLVSSANYTAYADLTKTYTIFAQIFGPANVSAFADEAAAASYINSRTFEGVVTLGGLSNGDKVTSIGGDNYFIAKRANNELYFNGGSRARNAFGVASTRSSASFEPLYNGSLIYSFSSGAFSPLPAANLFEVLSAVDTVSLMAKAIELTGLDDVITSGDHTIFAVSNTVFSAYTGYTSVADLDTLAVGGDEDLDVLDELAEVLSRHIVPNSVQFSIVMANDLPGLVNALDEVIFFTVVDGQVVIVGDLRDISGTSYSLLAVDILSANGVIHVLDGVLEIE